MKSEKIISISGRNIYSRLLMTKPCSSFREVSQIGWVTPVSKTWPEDLGISFFFQLGLQNVLTFFSKKYQSQILIAYDTTLAAFWIGPPLHIDYGEHMFVVKYVNEEVEDSPESISSPNNGNMALKNFDTLSGSGMAASSHESPEKLPKVPKPANSWILYRQSKHAGVVAENPGMHNSEICKFMCPHQSSEQLTRSSCTYLEDVAGRDTRG